MSAGAANAAKALRRARARAAIAFVAVTALAACSPKSEAPAAPPAVLVSTPLQRMVTDWDDFTGRFEARDTVEVRARVSGYLDRVAFRDGQIVKRGQLLFVIDPRPYAAAVTEAEGAVAQARARATYARSQVARARVLITTDAIARSSLDQRTQDLQAADAAVTSAVGALERARLNLGFTRVVAPLSGRISRKLVSEGNLVAGGDTGATLLTTIVSLDPIDLYFDVDEQTYLKYTRLQLEGLRPSSRTTPNPVRVALSDEETPSRSGTMDFVDNRLDRSTGTLRGRAILANHDLALSPGQFARVQLIGSAPYRALLIPETAISNDQSRKIVYVVGADGHAQVRPVTLGRLFGHYRVIASGLRPADRVVVEGLQRVRPGEAVTARVAPIVVAEADLTNSRSIAR